MAESPIDYSALLFALFLFIQSTLVLVVFFRQFEVDIRHRRAYSNLEAVLLFFSISMWLMSMTIMLKSLGLV